LLGATLAIPAAATPPAEPRVEQSLLDDALKFLDALRRFLDDPPIFSAPEITRDGDIILRRQPGGQAAPERPAPTARKDESVRL